MANSYDPTQNSLLQPDQNEVSNNTQYHGLLVGKLLWGSDDDDIIHGNNYDNLIYGGWGSDTIYGQNGDDYLVGGNFDHIQDKDDVIYGGAGKDTLYGGVGNDTLYGGAGEDTFSIHYNLVGQKDFIADFNINEDEVLIYGSSNYELKYERLNNIGSSNIDTLIYQGDTLIAIAQDVSLLVKNFYINFEAKVFDNFTKAQYLASHGDLINAFGNRQHAYKQSLSLAFQHYDGFGASENRVLDSFEEAQYLASHDDLINIFGNRQHSYQRTLELATQHYIEFGASENRSLNRFDAASYLNNYSDLQAAFGNDLMAATQHYIEFGASEGRVY